MLRQTSKGVNLSFTRWHWGLRTSSEHRVWFVSSVTVLWWWLQVEKCNVLQQQCLSLSISAVEMTEKHCIHISWNVLYGITIFKHDLCYTGVYHYMYYTHPILSILNSCLSTHYIISRMKRGVGRVFGFQWHFSHDRSASVNIPHPADRKHNKNCSFIRVVSNRSISIPTCWYLWKLNAASIVFWPLASVLWNNATLKDLQVALDLVGVSAKAVEEVKVFHQAPLSAVRRQRSLRRRQAADRVTYYPQHLHLGQRGHTSDYIYIYIYNTWNSLTNK